MADHLQCQNNHVSFWTTSNRHTRVTITCSSRQQATSMHSDYLRVSQPRVPLDNKQPNTRVTVMCSSGQQATTMHSDYEYHNRVPFWTTSNRHTRVTVTCSSGQQATTMHSDYIRVSQPRVLLDKQETTRVTVTRSSGQQTPTIQSNYPQRHKYVSWTSTWQKCNG